MFYSIVIPVYNRPDELQELLDSLTAQSFKQFEVIVVEDGSTIPSKDHIERFDSLLAIKYIQQENQGPGLARNSGAALAKGDYLIFLDSDTITPTDWLRSIDNYLLINEVDMFGGRDEALSNFTEFQQAINYSMTSLFTTGGIRGSKRKGLDKFFPRSFNMGIKTDVFNSVGGFSSLRYGEDIDLSYRIVESGHTTAFIDAAFVYHKRRNTRKSFFFQVFYSGAARINLTLRYPKTLKLVHTLPTLFVLFALFTVVTISTLVPFIAYAVLLFVDSLRLYGNINLSIMVVETSFIQLAGYGLGFLYGIWRRIIRRKSEQESYKIEF